jgi:hypothetical protein
MRRSLAGFALGLAVLLPVGCGSKAKVAGTPTNKVNAIELGRSLNADRTIKDPRTPSSAPTRSTHR